jgi:hypothetical protein
MATNAIVLNGQIGLPTSRQLLAAAGAYFTVNNPTQGTAVAFLVGTTTSATAQGMFVIQNKGTKNIYLDRLELFQTATAPVGTSLRFEVYNETGIVVGTTAVTTITPVQINTAAAQGTGAVVQAFATGGITIPAAVGVRVLQGIANVACGVQVVKDTVIVDFGADGVATAHGGATAARATDSARLTGQTNPIIIAPGTTSWINSWGYGTNIPSFEYQLSYIEL